MKIEKATEAPNSSLNGGIWSLWILFLPLLGTSLTGYIFPLFENALLARVSSTAMKSAFNASYACEIFQAASIALVMMAQVFVAKSWGARDLKAIGPIVWQFIWASLLSLLITVPFSLLYGVWFFKGTEIEMSVVPYYYLLTWFNFLYPLGASLTCFFLGRGEVRLILLISVADQISKVTLSYLLIFGFSPWIQPVGFLGGLIANLTTQGLFCLVLFGIFTHKKNSAKFNTRNWQLRPSLFLNSLSPGLFRALYQGLNAAGWGLIAHLMVSRGEDFLLVLTTGGLLTAFLPFIYEAIYQSQTIVVSQILGANQPSFLLKAAKSGIILASAFIAFGAIFLLGSPSFTIRLLFPDITLSTSSIRTMLLGVWLWFAYFTISSVPVSYIISFKDTKFYFYLGGIFLVTDYFLMYFFIEIVQIEASLFWLVLAGVQLASSIPIYFWRMHYLCKNASLNKEPVLQG